jgi:hypothetical protein
MFGGMVLGWPPSKNVSGDPDFQPRCPSRFPIGFYVKLISAVGAIFVEGPHRRTHFWKRTIHWLSSKFSSYWANDFRQEDFYGNFPYKGVWNLKKIFSETTEPISTKLCWNDLWVVLIQNCVRHFRPPTKMAATAELNLTLDHMGNSHKNLLVWNHLLNKN